MSGRAKISNGDRRVSVYGGQTFDKSVFPPTKYIQGLMNAYCPDANFTVVSVYVCGAGANNLRVWGGVTSGYFHRRPWAALSTGVWHIGSR
jgi:hypothetical protein